MSSCGHIGLRGQLTMAFLPLNHVLFSLQLANFLPYLSTVLHLSASSVKMHRSAVRTTIRQLGGPSLSSNTVRDLIRGGNARQASQPRRMPLPLSPHGS